uniref:Uncharacterized protein n=1 Tax=Salix viminalis TaxID=40686 RepID=A0A6N2MI43_SALVM
MPSTPSAKINRSLQQLNCHVISSSKTSPVKTKTTCFVLFCGGLSGIPPFTLMGIQLSMVVDPEI